MKSGEDSYEVVGDLTIHGVTKTIDLNVEDVTPEVKDPFGLFRRGAHPPRPRFCAAISG